MEEKLQRNIGEAGEATFPCVCSKDFGGSMTPEWQ